MKIRKALTDAQASRYRASTVMRIDGKAVELTAGTRKRAPRPGKRIYDHRIDEAIRGLWVLFDQECGKRLAVAIWDTID